MVKGALEDSWICESPELFSVPTGLLVFVRCFRRFEWAHVPTPNPPSSLTEPPTVVTAIFEGIKHAPPSIRLILYLTQAGTFLRRRHALPVTGDVVTVSGVVKSVNAEFASGRVNKRAKASGLYLIYLEANSLVNARQVRGVVLLFPVSTSEAAWCWFSVATHLFPPQGD